MLKIKYLFYIYILFSLLLGCVTKEIDRDVLFQLSTINALLEGIYDGEMTFKELKRHGDLGLGTFNALDGEMLMLDGYIYQVKADGKVYPAADSMKTPFSAVTFYEEDKTLILDSTLDYKSLEELLDKIIPTENIIYAIKIEGSFKYVRTRSVPAQEKPYPLLSEVVKNQPEFEFHNIKGELVGFRLPDYLNGINVPKYHLHFITENRKGGGHLLECKTNKVKIGIDFTDQLFVYLPQTKEFFDADLNKEEDLEKVER
ncbi:acetolactate decarboxylase [candidate division WOR-3 bacterium]|nr:acetolactate decarboxylase [candidate division WOR-3 bacterium]